MMSFTVLMASPSDIGLDLADSFKISTVILNSNESLFSFLNLALGKMNSFSTLLQGQEV